MEIPKLPTQEELKQHLVEKAKEAEAYLSEKGKDLQKQVDSYLSLDGKKETILKDLDANHSTKPEHAAQVLALYKATQDLTFLRNYLMWLPEGAGATLPTELQVELAKEAEKSGKIQGPGSLEYRKTLLIVNQALPAAAQANQERYEQGVSNEFLNYGYKAPPFVAGLPEELRQTIFKNNPLAYARTFPDSEWVSGEVLATVLSEDLNFNWNNTESLDATLCGQVVQGEIPGTPRDMHEGHLLANKNLSAFQLKTIAKRLADCYAEQAKAGEVKRENLEQRKNINRLVARLLSHKATGIEVHTILEKTFPTDTLSQKNNTALGRTENT